MTEKTAHSVSIAPSNTLGALYCLMAVGLTGGAVALSASSHMALWLIGQLLFALAFLEWFLLLHEAGHGTLFRHRGANWIAGALASFLAIIPHTAWKQVHARHHVWTGWQDMDVTTATLVPRQLARWEIQAINGAWRSGLPLFSVLYRLQNYWNVPRLRHYLAAQVCDRIRAEVMLLLGLYGLTLILIGPLVVLHACGLGLLLALMFQDPLLLSQHTHMPRHLAEGAEVRPFTLREQEQFTRSIRFPNWFSWLILHFDAHELHHIYPHVAGYHLRRIPYQPANEVNWWQWLRAAKRLSGVEFLFGRRETSGFPY